jgi:superfamily I DNA/RNA helicase
MDSATRLGSRVRLCAGASLGAGVVMAPAAVFAEWPGLEARLAALAPDQRAAATAPSGPVLCIAPAGSGKTTTLIARAAWLIATGADPGALCAVTFNRRAAEELEARLGDALGQLGVDARSVRVRTFHALGREVLIDARARVEPLVDRGSVLEEVIGRPLTRAELRRLDEVISRLKLNRPVELDGPSASALDGAVTNDVAMVPDPELPWGPSWEMEAFAAYEAALAARGALDFDDLLRRPLAALQRDPDLLSRWRAQCRELLVDEVQDLDRTQLAVALLLAAPANRLFLVGDDDQTIYAWRLADVRRVLGLAGQVPGLRRLHLETNYRCPRPVVRRAVRLVEHNRERFPKVIRSRAEAPGRLILAPDPGDDAARARRLLTAWPADPDGTYAILARTNAELAPYAAVALERGIPYAAEDDGLSLDDPLVDRLLEHVEGAKGEWRGLLPALLEAAGVIAAAPALAAGDDTRDVGGAVLQWAAGLSSVDELRAVVERARGRRAELRRADAQLVLATVHTTKGLEFDHVACVGLDEGRFPNARSLAEGADPDRALEEERRLAYVAWTRARRSLLLLYDPDAPSGFLLEAFSLEELRG